VAPTCSHAAFRAVALQCLTVGSVIVAGGGLRGSVIPSLRAPFSQPKLGRAASAAIVTFGDNGAVCGAREPPIWAAIFVVIVAVRSVRN